MKRRTFDEGDDGQPLQIDGPEKSLMCRMSGCSNRWSVDILHGRVCSDHDRSLSAHGSRRPGLVHRPTSVGALPIADALPHWQDDEQRS